MDAAVLGAWEAAAAAGALRNDLSGMEHRVVDGALGLVLLFNEAQVTGKRMPPAREAAIPVFEPFDPEGFHFGRCAPEETLLELGEEQEHALLLNVSPLLPGHSLLVPFVGEQLPQVLSPDVLLEALQFCDALSAPDARVAFNSRGGFSSVNHLHFHVVWLGPVAEQMPVERCAARSLAACCVGQADDDSAVVAVEEVLDWPVRCFRFRGGTLEARADVAGTLVCTLIEMDVAHNVLVSRDAVTVFPRRQQAPSFDGGVLFACLELPGVLVCKTRGAFEALADEQLLVREMRERVSLSRTQFDSVKGAFLSAVLPSSPSPSAPPSTE